METRQAISLFSGCGGDSLGLQKAGFQLVAFNEFNKAAILSHEANFPDSKLIDNPATKATDITKIPDEEFQKYTGKVDVIFAGFPCQGFSRAGKKKASDPRNQMFRQFVRAVKNIKPPFFIGENVVGLTTMKSGPNESDPLMLDIIKGAFEEIGYKLTHQVLEAVEFGVPQKRKRILLIGWDTSRITEFEATSFWAAVHTIGSENKMPLLRSFVTNSMEGAHLLKKEEIPDGFDSIALPISQEAEPTGTPHPFVVLKSNEKLLSCTKRDSPIHSEVMNLSLPSKTIICTYDHQPRLLVGLRKPDGTSYVRTLLPDELKQIQGFPADYKILGNTKEKIVQIGNAVPPPMIEAVGKKLMSFLSEKKKIKPRLVKK